MKMFELQEDEESRWNTEYCSALIRGVPSLASPSFGKPAVTRFVVAGLLQIILIDTSPNLVHFYVCPIRF